MLNLTVRQASSSGTAPSNETPARMMPAGAGNMCGKISHDGE